MATNRIPNTATLPLKAGRVKAPWRLDLFAKLPWLKRLVRMRSFQFLLILPNLLLFYLFIVAGLFGTPIGNRNIIIVFVWILWWFVLIAVMVPFASRLWCTMCPLPFFGDWLQRRSLVKVRPGNTVGLRNKWYGLNKRWPRKFSNIWLQNIGFLLLATFSTLLVTRPIVSVIVLGGLIVIAAGLALIYRQRAFCNYVCPISGFLSLYSMTSTIELRSKDRDECKKCKSKACIRGNDHGWACPWYVYMGKLDRNNYCGLCFECVKSCPNDNISLFARPFCSDTRIKGYDESWKAFIMLVLAMLYSVTLLGPWGRLKDWANISETGNWKGFLTYAGATWFVALVGFPLIYYAAIWLGRKLSGTDAVATKDLFIGYSYTLVPLGLLAWIAFSVPLVFVNGSYIVTVISDPLGRGWNLFGTTEWQWTPFYPEYTVPLQIVLLLIGLYYAFKRGREIAISSYQDQRQAVRSLIPTGILLTGVTLVFLRLYVG